MQPGRGFPLPPGHYAPFPGAPGMPGMPMPGMPMPGMPHGMPGRPMMMPPGFPMHPGMHGMPGMPGMPGMMPMMPMFPGFQMPPGMMHPGMFPPRGPPMQTVVSAAPVLNNPPPNMVHFPAVSGPGALSQFNANNPSSAANQTSNLLNRHIFSNALAGLPLNIVVVKIPLDFEDGKLAKIFEACGKLTKFVRPVDPMTSIPSSFAVISYAQALCALRAVTLADGLLVNEQTQEKIEVKLGYKESLAIISLRTTEEEAAAALPEGSTLEDVHAPIRAAIQSVLGTLPEANAQASEAFLDGLTPNAAAPSATAPAAVSVPAAAAASDAQGVNAVGDGNVAPVVQNYYDYLAQQASAGQEGEDKGESILFSEIGKFRERQLQRDKILEEQRREKIKSKIRSLQEAKLLSALSGSSTTASTPTANSQPPPPAPPAAQAPVAAPAPPKRKVEDEAEQAAKRRRKLEVLQMLSGDITGTGSSDASSSGAMTIGGMSQPIRMDFKRAAAASTTEAVAAGAVPVFGGEDEEEAPRRLLPIYEEEEAAAAGDSSAAMAGGHAEDEDYGDLQDSYTSKKKKGAAAAGAVPARPAAMGARDIQAKVMQQAALVSQSLLTNSAPAAAVPAGNAGPPSVEQLLAQIPTDPKELFAYPVKWELIAHLIQTTLKTWIITKIINYLGEEEVSLTNYILSKLNAQCAPQDLVEELSMVLDEDAEGFVKKLWSMLVYYTLLKESELKAAASAGGGVRSNAV